MSIETDPKTGRHRWYFKATINGRLYRFTKLLRKGWSRAEADAYDVRYTAKTYKRLSEGGAGFIDEAVQLYLEHCIPQQADGKHAARCLGYMLPFYEGRPLDELGDVSRDIMKAFRGLGLAERTIRQRLSYLRAAAYYALERHKLGRVDWILQMELPEGNWDKTEFMSRADILRLARACKDRRARAWILMTFWTGSRPGECHRAVPRDGALYLPKDKKGKQIIKPVVPRMQRYLRYWPMKYGYGWYSERYRAARLKAGLDNFTPHDGRHAIASDLLERGASLEQVAHVLDHKSVASTKTYSHLATKAKLKLLQSISKKGHAPSASD